MTIPKSPIDHVIGNKRWRSTFLDVEIKNLGSDVNHIIFGTIPLYTCSILIQVVYFEVNLVTRLVILSVTREIQHEQGRQLNLSSF